MDYNISDIKSEVRVAMDENRTSSSLADFGDVDTLSLDELIESKIVDAVRLLECSVPASLIDNDVQLGEADSSTGKITISINWRSAIGVGPGTINLPSDFMRLVMFRMSDWSRNGKIITEDSPEYVLQSSRYPGVRGNPQAPVVAVVKRQGGYALEFYSSSAGESVFVRYASYLKEPEIKDGNISISSKLERPVIYEAAVLTALSLGEKDLAENLNVILKNLIAPKL